MAAGTDRTDEQRPGFSRGTFLARGPLRVYWELTRACDLACRHCRAEAQPARAADELTTEECRAVLAELALAGPPTPHVIFTGGDPLKRPDLLELIRDAVARGLGVSLAPRATTLATRETERDLEAIAEIVQRLGAARWSLFFLVPVGRGRVLTPLTAREAETTLGWVARNAGRWRFTVTTTEAPHFRRIMLERMRADGRSGEAIRQSPLGRGFGIRDGNGIMFIAANGDVTPSGFLPLVVGNVRWSGPLSLYRDDDMFQALREPDRFHGRCDVCEYRALCGGSRACAWAATGDALGEDPLCALQPAAG